MEPTFLSVIPAQAGIQVFFGLADRRWMLASAGMTNLHST